MRELCRLELGTVPDLAPGTVPDLVPATPRHFWKLLPLVAQCLFMLSVHPALTPVLPAQTPLKMKRDLE